MAYSKKIWDAVLHEWLAGQLSLSDITRTYGPSRSGILKRSVREKWPSRGSLNDEVRKEIQSALLKSGGISINDIKRRANSEAWFCRVRKDKTKAYITSMLPADIQLALKANKLPAIKEDKLCILGIRRDQKVYREQEEKVLRCIQVSL